MNNLKYILINSYDKETFNQISNIHIKSLSEGGFITLFGNRFLEEIYKDILLNNLGFLIVAKNNYIVSGFILGCYNSNEMFKTIIYKKFFKYIFLILPHILLKPFLIVKLFETFLYNKKEKSTINAELVVIAIDNNFRNSGIGSNLVNYLDNEFMKKNISEYKVTVHESNINANKFYTKKGMKLVNSFNMYHKKWNLYVNTLK